MLEFHDKKAEACFEQVMGTISAYVEREAPGYISEIKSSINDSNALLEMYDAVGRIEDATDGANRAELATVALISLSLILTLIRNNEIPGDQKIIVDDEMVKRTAPSFTALAESITKVCASFSGALRLAMANKDLDSMFSRFMRQFDGLMLCQIIAICMLIIAYQAACVIDGAAKDNKKDEIPPIMFGPVSDEIN